MVKYCVEVEEQNRKDSINFYGLENEVIITSNGYRKDYKVEDFQEVIVLIDRLVKNLVSQGCTVINKEVK